MELLSAYSMENIRIKLTNMKAIKLFLLPIMMCFIIYIFLTDASAATIVAKSCSRSDVQAAVNNSSRGDTVAVPACSTTIWPEEVTITKAISIQGAGIDRTVIKAGFRAGTGYSSGKWLFRYVPSSPASDQNVLFEITGFTFNEDSRAGSVIVRNDKDNTMPLRQVRIHHNKIINSYGVEETSNEYANSITIEGVVYGVIDNNTITGVPRVGNFGSSYGTSGKIAWDDTTFEYGSANNMYWEDNTFTKDTILIEGNRQCMTYGDRGGRYVFRYNNIINNTTNGFYVWDMHGTQTNGSYANRSTMGAELYGNYISNTKSLMQVWGHRGGRLIALNNYVSIGSNGSANAVILDEAHEYYAPTNHFCPGRTFNGKSYASCASDGMSQEQEKSFMINNRKYPGNTLLNTEFVKWGNGSLWDGHQITLNTANASAYNYNTSCTASSCSSGVGCGSAKPTGTCTVGAGYWQTDQSCSAITDGSYGVNPAKPISGTLYRCTSTNRWEAFYTPYQYPHPLRTGDTEIVSAPKGFKLVN